MQEVISTTVKNSIIRKTLLQGTICAGVGIIIIAYCLLYVDAQILEKVGLFAYLLSSGLIAYGLIPFRTLSRLQLFPNSFHIHESSICYLQNNRKILSFPRSAISCIDYVEHDARYGITISFQDMKALTIFDKKVYRSLRKKDVENDVLFFPYFTKKALTLK